MSVQRTVIKMILETLRSCTLEEIEIGEVFAIEGSWEIHIKTGNRAGLHLADDWWGEFWDEEIPCLYNNTMSFYKLPLKTQHLWKEE